MLKGIRISLWILMQCACTSLVASATATAIITYSIGNFDLIDVSSQTITLNVNAAAAGNQPATATDSSTTYSITSNGSSRKIYGSYAPLMPGPILSANLTPPAGAVSLGNVVLSDRPVPLVSGIENVSEQNLPITYSLTTTVTNAPSVHQVTITYTVAP